MRTTIGRRRELGARAMRTALADLARAVRLLAQATRSAAEDGMAVSRAEGMASDVLHRLDPRSGS